MCPLLSGLLVVALASVPQELPTFSVALSRRVGLDAARGEALVDQLSAALGAAFGTPVSTRELRTLLTAGGFPDTAVCAGKAPCMANLAKVAQVDLVVALQVVRVADELTFDVALIDARTGVTRATASGRGTSAGSAGALAVLAERLKAAAPKTPAPVVTAPPDVPAAARPLEPAAPVAEQMTPGSGPAPLNTVGVVLIGLGAVCVGVGVGLGVDAEQRARRLDPFQADFELQGQRLLRQARAADALYVTGAVAAVSAALLWVVQALWFDRR